MTRQEMIENLEYLCGGIDAILTMCKKDSKWNELLNNWITIVSSVADALGDEEHAADT